MEKKGKGLKKLFNPINVNTIDERMINGQTTNLLDLSYVPKDYEIFYDQVARGEANQWKPQKTPMSDDAHDRKYKFTKDEKEAYDLILSFLVFLDSIQTNNLGNIANYTTSPHVVYALARQSYEEANHSMSYGWMLSSLMPKQEAFELVNAWQDNETLFNRNKYIADIYQRFIDDPNDETYVESCVANYLLEGLYFYNGFQFFHTLASRGLAIGSDTQISYIQRDELGHCVIFQHILLILKKEEPELMSRMEESIYEQFRIAADWEIKFSHEIIGDRILGMSKKSITENTYYLGNKRLKAIGLKPIFPKTKNPYKHLDKLSGTENEDSNRTNNFEGSAITYKQPDILKGWEDL